METKPGSSDIHLPPGFRFHPSDVELINHYLKNKVTSSPLPASIIADIDLYKYNPWELPKKALYGEDEWYFFTPRDRKYPNGARPNRAAASGYWKATGTDKPILNSSGTTSIGVKKALVFYKGRLPKGIKTDWFMLEYRLIDSMPWNSKRKGSSMRLDDWVLCRVRQKSSIPRSTWEDHGSGPVPAGHHHGPAGGCSYPKPKASDLPRTNVDPNIEMVKNSLYNDCPMLPYIIASPYILASQDLPFSTETAASNIGFQSPSTQRSSTTTTYTDISSFDNIFNLAKRKLEEAGQGEICDLPSKKLKEGDIAHMNLCDMDQAEESNFNPIQWSSLMQFQELNQLAFAGGY